MTGSSLPVRLLTLNYTDAAPAAEASVRLFQFALAPEDEARVDARWSEYGLSDL